VSEQTDLFIHYAESELVVVQQNTVLQIDPVSVEFNADIIEHQLLIENPVHELVVQDENPTASHEVYEPWDKQGIIEEWEHAKAAMLMPLPSLNTWEEITEESLNRHARETEKRIVNGVVFLSYLVSQITK